MPLSMDVEAIARAIDYGGFYLIAVTLALTWVVEFVLRPRTRQEWAEFAKITAFTIIVVRFLLRIATGRALAPEVGMVVSSVCFLFVAFFLVVLLDDWGPPFVRAFCRFCIKRKVWLIPAGVALVVAAIVYGVFFA